MALKLTTEDVDELFDASERQVREEPETFHRYLMDEIDWRDRLICIKGPRGTGKTTLMRQRVKEKFGPEPTKALYASLDDLWFARHRVKDLVEYLYEHGFTHVFLDEVHHLGSDWSQVLKNISDQFRNMNIVYSGSSLLQLEKAAPRGGSGYARPLPRATARPPRSRGLSRSSGRRYGCGAAAEKDPVFPGSDWLSQKPRLETAPLPVRPGSICGRRLSLSSWNNLTNDYFVCHRRAAISKQYHGLVDNDPRWLSFPSLAQAPDKDSTAFNADGSTMMGVRVVNNIFYYPDQGKTDLVHGRRHFSMPDNPFDRNVYWSGNPTNITFKIGKGYDWKTWREAGQDADSVLADPMFVDPANGDYRLRPESPALARGFKEIPYAEIGLRRTKFRKELR